MITAIERIKQLESLVKEKDEALAKLNEQVATPSKLPEKEDKELNDVKTQLVELSTKNTDLAAKLEAATKAISELSAKNDELVKAQTDFDKRVSDEAQRMFVNAGTQQVKAEPMKAKTGYIIENRLERK